MTERGQAIISTDGKWWKGCYGKEPFDLRLTVLRLFYKLPVIALVTCLGTLVFGGGYYVKNVLLRNQRSYAVTSVYRVEYATDTTEDFLNSYINEMSWNTYIQSGMFLEMVQARLAGAAELSNQELAESLAAYVWSDLRVPAITVTTEDPAKSDQVARAVEAVMTQDFTLREIETIAVIDSGTVTEVFPDMRVGRAFLLSAVLSCFFAVVLFLLKETGDDSIWLPGSLWKRYGLKTVGTLQSRELFQNMQYFFRQKDSGRDAVSEAVMRKTASTGCRIAVCMVQEGMKPEVVLEKLKERCPEIVDDSWFAVGSPLTEPGVCGVLREADGILLAVKAGCHAGKKLEYVLEYLEQQDCGVTAAILWEADEKLLRRYYFVDIPKR